MSRDDPRGARPTRGPLGWEYGNDYARKSASDAKKGSAKLLLALVRVHKKPPKYSETSAQGRMK